MRSPEETSSGCGGVNTPTQELNLLSYSEIKVLMSRELMSKTRKYQNKLLLMQQLVYIIF